MTLIDGKAISEQVKQEIAAEVAEIVARGGKRPHLAAILVGHDGGSETYVAAKVKACEVCGFKSSLIRYESDVTEDELLAKVRELNDDEDIDGFIVQLPLPKHISEQKVIETIDYRKDVDGFHPINVGRMSIGLPCYVSATPNGILELLKRYQIETSGKKCVVLGRSNIVGKPMAALMMQKAYPGDEDQGQMSSWYILSSIGLFQMDGGCSKDPVWLLGSPRFDRVEILLDNTYYSGKKLIIKAENVSKDNCYIQYVRFNNKRLSNNYIEWSKLKKGGTLHFIMGDRPNPNAFK